MEHVEGWRISLIAMAWTFSITAKVLGFPSTHPRGFRYGSSAKCSLCVFTFASLFREISQFSFSSKGGWSIRGIYTTIRIHDAFHLLVAGLFERSAFWVLRRFRTLGQAYGARPRRLVVKEVLNMFGLRATSYMPLWCIYLLLPSFSPGAWTRPTSVKTLRFPPWLG